MNVDPQARRVTLPVHMALEVSSAWYDQLVPYLELEHVTLDGGQVQDIDTPALEALVAFCLTRTHRRLTTKWSALSPNLRERIERQGLMSMLLLSIAT